MLARAAVRQSRVVARRAASSHAHGPQIHVLEGTPSKDWLAKNAAVTDHAARALSSPF